MPQYLRKSARLFKRYNYKNECFKISFSYLLLGVLWICFFDKIIYFFSPDETYVLVASTYKGWIFVIVTSLILYFLIHGLLKRYEKLEEKNLYLSYTDALTGFYNRRYYEMEIKRINSEMELPISIILADVNGLKMINDAFGHKAGDDLLKKSAEVIRRSSRPNDIAARCGGDEFVILLPHTTFEEAGALADQIRDGCYQENVNHVPVSMSLGWATKISSSEELSEILKSAEDEMYKHKIIQNEGLRRNIINTIINALYEKNQGEEEHSRRVGEIAEKIGKAIGFSDMQVSRLKEIGQLHDIGNIGIEEGILNKTSCLTEREQKEIRRHPDIGYRILSASGQMLDMADCVLAHHERWDGQGYPRGLSGSAIPIDARIIALAESYDAMSSERPYRKALNEEVILYEIKKNAGRQFDPDIARAFVERVLGKPWNESF